MRRYVAGLIVSLVTLFAAAHAAEVAVPRDLEQWRGWVLQDQDYRRCPLLASAPATSPSSYRCVWPERLVLVLDANGGTFTQRWRVFAESWIRLPGSIDHWPQAVRVDGAQGAVVARDGFPSLLLSPGTHAIAGQLSWPARPESIAVDARTAIVDLTLDGKRVAQPERPEGAVWLGKRRSAEQPARMDIQVYRLLQDSVPTQLQTRVRLQVSGDGREELLARVLPEGFIPIALQSSLPARIEPDGRLRVQARAGSWDIDIEARGTGVAARIARPPASDGLWAREEVWSFAGDDRLRVAVAQGAEGIDPAQANVPDEWRGYPAFRMAADSTLEIAERSRGLQNADDNRLTLLRDLWLDFDHGGFTAVDRVRGAMRKDWRLEMSTPYSLESARMGAEPLLVTVNSSGQGTGLEVRTPNLNLSTVARTSSGRGQMPATGWNTRFEQVTGRLNLPPGHRLLAAFGADHARGAWVEEWGLWGLFGVLVVAVFSGWIAGPIVGVVAFVALLLTYQESPSYIWLWSNLLAALALARAAPEGRLRRFARGYRAVSFAVLGVALLPLLWGQARLALHPQLAPGGSYAAIHLLMTPRTAVGVASPAAEPPAQLLDERAELRRSPAQKAPEYSESESLLEQTTVTAVRGLNSQQVVQRYAPGTLVQTGPGIPAWQYVTYVYDWSGPVDPEQSVRFLYVGPVVLGIWRFLSILMLAALFIALAQASDRGSWQWPDARDAFRRWFVTRARAGTSAANVAAVAFALLLLGAASPAARAEPDAALLSELETRLTRPPSCTPSCAEVTSAQVSVRGDRLEVSLNVSALTSIALPVPTAGDRWQLDAVTVDGRSTLTVGREGNGTLAVPLAPGAHEVRISGQLPAATSIQLEFPSAPRFIAVNSDGWDASGVNEGRLLAGSLELVRRRGSVPGGAPLETASEFPAFVRVVRTFNLALDWTVATNVVRIAPEKAAVNVEVPLAPGESVLSASLRTRDVGETGRRVALVGLERGEPETTWSSGLARSETLELQMPADAARTEVWAFVVSPQWNVAFEGFPAVLPENIDAQGSWVYEFHPRPGEKLRLRVSRPERASGATLAIDSVRQNVTFGKRSAITMLELQYRSTQGGRHAITLPKAARVRSVQLDGQEVQLRPDDGVLSIGLLPGTHSVSAQWELPGGASVRTRVPGVDLHSPASNVQTSLLLPADRWSLFASGPGVGPAVLYWSELVVFIITALLLGRWKASPLRTHEWLLLGFGLSTLSWGVLAVVALWLFAVRWRERWAGDVSRWRFNLVQVALAAATVVAVAALLFWGIRQSLLASPDMGVAGPGSEVSGFAWFVDRTDSVLPQPTTISLPMWVYRALMFAWALWLVLALLRWLRWTWQAWKTNGIWRGAVAGA